MDICAAHAPPLNPEALQPAHTGSVAAPRSVRDQGGRRARGPWMSLSPRIEGSSLGGPPSSSRSLRHPITFDHALPRFHLLRALRARGLQGGWFLRGQSDLELSEDVRHSADIGWPSSSRRYQSCTESIC